MADTAGTHPPLAERLKESVKESVDIPKDKPQKEKKRKEKKKSNEPKAPKTPKSKPASKPPKAPKEAAAPVDPEAIFKEGFLKHVYEERPTAKSDGGNGVVTRFPPEPNGYLHIGHSKAIAINFGFAKYYGGITYLRYDDTNPEKEDETYFTSIRETVEWLGFKPCAITYSSDHFQRLYDLAEDLIKRGKAYVCHCTKEEINHQRGGKEGELGNRYACKHRDRPVEESLTEFRAMRDGKYKAKEASLRMKQDLVDGNPQMWDLTAYRIIDDAEHHRTGKQWRIYPTYDFTHCLCDSFENITHSLCTTEFINSRQSYEWLCDALEVYRPMQREYGRLNITGTVLSKRKITKLVDEKYVNGWDDPRLYTLVALRRRGVPPGAILSFVSGLGVTTSNTSIQLSRFEQAVRRYLEQTVPRLMLILDPIPVVITNLPDDYVEEVELPFSPKDPSMGSHRVPFTKTVYIDRSDFREVDSKDYFRLAPGKAVGLLKVPYPVKAESFEKDDTTGLVTKVYATYEKPEEGASFKKPKAYITWVGESPKHGSPVSAEVRVFNSLFKSDNPDSTEGGFLNDINPDSLNVYSNAMVEVGFNEVRKRAPWPETVGETDQKTVGPETCRFQGMRVAYFTLDSDTTTEKIILNRIVSLKEDSGK